MKNFRFRFLFLIFACFFSLPSLAYHIKDKEHLMEILQNSGFTLGMTVWLKVPLKLADGYGNLPGLSKLTIVDADIVLKKPGLQHKRVVIFTKDDEGNDKKLVLQDDDFYIGDEKGMPYLLIEQLTLYKTDPSKKVKKWGKKVLENIRNQTVQIGMTKNQVITSFGYPDKINKTSGEWGTHEQWIYPGDFRSMYLYIKNDRLTAAQEID